MWQSHSPFKQNHYFFYFNCVVKNKQSGNFDEKLVHHTINSQLSTLWVRNNGTAKYPFQRATPKNCRLAETNLKCQLEVSITKRQLTVINYESIMNQLWINLNQLPVDSPAQLVRALQRYHRGQGSNLGKPDIFQAFFLQLH